jgi:hypothetical protein
LKPGRRFKFAANKTSGRGGEDLPKPGVVKTKKVRAKSQREKKKKKIGWGKKGTHLASRNQKNMDREGSGEMYPVRLPGWPGQIEGAVLTWTDELLAPGAVLLWLSKFL